MMIFAISLLAIFSFGFYVLGRIIGEKIQMEKRFEEIRKTEKHWENIANNLKKERDEAWKKLSEF